MLFSETTNINTKVTKEASKLLAQKIFREMTRIANRCQQEEDKLVVYGLSNTFGSILRDDTTKITIKPNQSQNGFLIQAETEYKPSAWFWIFFVIDILLIETIIGFVFGMGLTLGLYFYHKNLVGQAIHQALNNIQQNYQ